MKRKSVPSAGFEPAIPAIVGGGGADLRLRLHSPKNEYTVMSLSCYTLLMSCMKVSRNSLVSCVSATCPAHSILHELIDRNQKTRIPSLSCGLQLLHASSLQHKDMASDPSSGTATAVSCAQRHCCHWVLRYYDITPSSTGEYYCHCNIIPILTLNATPLKSKNICTQNQPAPHSTTPYRWHFLRYKCDRK